MSGMDVNSGIADEPEKIYTQDEMQKMSNAELRKLSQECSQKLNALLDDIERQQYEQAKAGEHARVARLQIKKAHKSLFNSRYDIGIKYRILDFFFTPANPFDSKARRGIKPVILINMFFAVVVIGVLIYALSGGE
jgi:hypothetical protein